MVSKLLKLNIFWVRRMGMPPYCQVAYMTVFHAFTIQLVHFTHLLAAKHEAIMLQKLF